MLSCLKTVAAFVLVFVFLTVVVALAALAWQALEAATGSFLIGMAAGLSVLATPIVMMLIALREKATQG